MWIITMRDVSKQLDLDQKLDNNWSETTSQRTCVRTRKQYYQMACFIPNQPWLHFKPEESTGMDLSYGIEAQAGVHPQKCSF